MKLEKPEEMLDAAIDNAEKLLKELLEKQAEALANPPKISPEDFAEGKAAMQNAVAAARRMLKALQEAKTHHLGDLN